MALNLDNVNIKKYNANTTTLLRDKILRMINILIFTIHHLTYYLAYYLARQFN